MKTAPIQAAGNESPAQQQEILVRSTVDGTVQPSLFYKTTAAGKRPLLVGLHTWSHNRFNQVKAMVPVAEAHGFHLLLPEFRGANLNNNPHCTEACGSACARQDILDAIDHVIANYEIDRENVFLLGASGGGHMAALMAGTSPERFKAIGAFVPITDLVKWAQQNENYRPHMLACCSGDEGEMRKRSSITYVDTLARANLKLFHGKYDPIVPVSHSIELFNAVQAKYPRSHVYLDVFDGGHEMDLQVAMAWLLSQYKKVNKEAVTG